MDCWQMWTADWKLNTQSAPTGIEYKDYVIKLKLGQLSQRYRQNLFAAVICHFRNDIRGNGAEMYPPILLILDRYQWEGIKSVGIFGRACLNKGLTVLSWLMQTALRVLMIMANIMIVQFYTEFPAINTSSQNISNALKNVTQTSRNIWKTIREKASMIDFGTACMTDA